MKSISCKEAVLLILKKEERKLSVWERVKLWQHQSICSLCRTFSSQNNFINKMIVKQKVRHKFQLSDEEKANIVRNVLKDDQQ